MNNHQDIEGWLTHEEGSRLADHAVQCQDLIVEIGAYRGRSSMYIAQGILNRCAEYLDPPVFYSIDPHDGTGVNGTKFDESDMIVCYNNLADNAQLGQFVRKLVASSSQVAPMFADRSIDMLFIDGDHSYEGVTDDLRRYIPKMKQEGLIFMHDWQLGSVRQAVDNFDSLVCEDQVQSNLKALMVNHNVD
jgi:predicted O-methyltransferase YrrM